MMLWMREELGHTCMMMGVEMIRLNKHIDKEV
jgi:hypothetical protein